MKPEYYITQLRDAFLRNDYEAQTEIAKKLLYYEESGTVTNDIVMEALMDFINGDVDMVYKDIKIRVINGKMSDDEISATVDQMIEQHPDVIFKKITFSVDNSHVDVTYTYDSVPIQRIRRITGYLVGTIDRFNNAKRAEVRDRVKHSLVG
jgi:hypothetical protein